MSQTRPLPLLRGRTTLSEALQNQSDILRRLTYPEKRLMFFYYLVQHTSQIETIVAHHLGVPKAACHAPYANEWLHGSFNVFIPIYIDGRKQAAFRVPLPYKVGEESHKGNAAEKLRCEVATYAWLNTHCPNIPTADLWGFSFPDGPSFTAVSRAPLLSRIRWHLKQWVHGLLGWYDTASAARYVQHNHGQDFEPGYMVMDFVDKGQMLSDTWDTIDGDSHKRRTLYRDIARIILSLAQVPLPRIGSLTMDNNCVVSLTNRPLLLELHRSENDEIPTDISRDCTYSTSDSFLLDQLACHDNHIRFQPNSIISQNDGEKQLAALTLMRALLPHYIDKEWRNGPFALTLTDLHSSNMFVDGNGHITCIIDLEYSCVCPMEMAMQQPFWLTQKAIDMLTGDNLKEYDQRRIEFVDAFRVEEKAMDGSSVKTSLMERSWENGTFWFYNALQSPDGLYNVFLRHIQPPYGMPLDDWGVVEPAVSSFWARGASQFIQGKLQEHNEYQAKIRDYFQQRTEEMERDEEEKEKKRRKEEELKAEKDTTNSTP